MKRDKLVDLKYHDIIHKTELAYLIQFEHDKEAVWIPKSQCDVDEDDRIVTMRESAAIEKEIEGYAI
jgi:hypothetical protein